MVTIECKKGLPFEYESFLIEKYESYVTTCRYVEIFYPTLETNHILVYKAGELIDLFVCGNDGGISKCFNLFTEFDQPILEKCIKKQFEEYPTIKKIEVGASYKRYDLAKSLLLDKTDDYVIDLPISMDDYFSKLGHNTRRTFRKQKSKLLKDYPTANFVAKYGNEIDEAIIEKIILMNIGRMNEKGVIHKPHFALNDIYSYCQYYGVVVYLEIDGEIVAGTISCIINKRIFGLIVAHDSKFSKYSVGMLIQLHELQVCIDRGVSALHFLWGNNDYKERLLGKPHALFSYLVYRNYSFDFILNKCKTLFRLAYVRFKQSKFSKPIRNIVKQYRRHFEIVSGF